MKHLITESDSNTSRVTLLKRALEEVRRLPKSIAGQGGDGAAYRVACTLIKGFRLEHQEAAHVMREWNSTHAFPPWTDAELKHKLHSAAVAESGEQTPKIRQSTDICIPLLMDVGVQELRQASPHPGPEELAEQEVLNLLFPGDPLICLGENPRKVRTALRSEFNEQVLNKPLIVPNPMSARFGLTKKKRSSQRCRSNTGPRRFIVVEFDFTDEKFPELLKALRQEGKTTLDACASGLLHLSAYAPLALVVHSGGKSLHGWFTVKGIPELRVHTFFQYACALGADPATWWPEQLVRFPNGTRESSGFPQSLLYLDPKKLPR